jgi:hypothetical protein
VSSSLLKGKKEGWREVGRKNARVLTGRLPWFDEIGSDGGALLEAVSTESTADDTATSRESGLAMERDKLGRSEREERKAYVPAVGQRQRPVRVERMEVRC